MNPFDQTIFDVRAPCMPCCTQPECACALQLPLFSSPYSDYASAFAVVGDPLKVACIAFLDDSTGLVSSISATDSGTDIAVSATYSSPVTVFGDVWLSISGTTGDTYSIAYTGASDIEVSIYDCAGGLLDTFSSSSSPAVSSPLATDGVHYLKFSVTDPTLSSPFTTASITVTPSGAYTANPVVALWDDSGTTRQLEACPRALIPINTEDTGNWYADLATATNYLSGSWVTIADGTFTYNEIAVSCIAMGQYRDLDPDGTTSVSFTASGTSSLSLDIAHDTAYTEPNNSFYASFSLLAGSTVSVAWSLDLSWAGTFDTSASLEVTLVSPDGSVFLVDGYISSIQFSPISASGTFVLGPIPYSGRYRFGASQSVGGGIDGDTSVVISMNVTSDDTMVVNPLQALYDVSLSCPARLDCV